MDATRVRIFLRCDIETLVEVSVVARHDRAGESRLGQAEI